MAPIETNEEQTDSEKSRITDQNERDITNFLRLVENAFDLAVVYSILKKFRLLGLITHKEHRVYTQFVIRLTASKDRRVQETLTFREVEDMAKQDQLINEDFCHNRLENQTINENTDNIRQINERLDEITRRVVNIEKCCKQIQEHYNRNVKVKLFASLACAIVNLFTMGIAGSAVSTIVESTLYQIIKFDDQSAAVQGIFDNIAGDFLTKNPEEILQQSVTNAIKKEDQILIEKVSITLDNYFGNKDSIREEEGKEGEKRNGLLNILGLALQVSMTCGILTKMYTEFEKKWDKDEDLIDFILKHMDIHLHIGSIQVECCSKLAKMSCGNDTIKENIVFKRGMGQIIKGMCQHGSNVDVQKSSCAILMNLAKLEFFEQFLREEDPDLIETVLRAMLRHLDNKHIMEYGCGVMLCLLSKYTFTHVKHEIFRTNYGLDIIFTAMEEHDDDSTNHLLLFNACGALCHFLCDPNVRPCDVEMVKEYNQAGNQIKRILYIAQSIQYKEWFVDLCVKALSLISS